MKIIVSSCLLGDNVKYDGNNNLKHDLVNFLKNYEIIKVCPEVMGGLSIPRIPSEIIDNKVINKEGTSVTKEYLKGAEKVLKIAILKDGSPSCGSSYIYDGTFTHTKVFDMGYTAKYLKENGIEVIFFNED